MARRSRRPPPAKTLHLSTLATRCTAGDHALRVDYVCHRTIATLDGLLRLQLQVRRCHRTTCPTAARAHLEAAQRWTAATGEVEVTLRCLELVARLALAEQSFLAAAAAAREGRDLAVTVGFGLFAIRFANLAAEPALASRPLPEAVAAAESALAAARARQAYAWNLLGEAAGLRTRLGHAEAACSLQALEGARGGP